MQKQFLPVHWIDGMKINKSHFIAQNNACTYQSAQAISAFVNEYNYGLLPHSLNLDSDTQLILSMDNQSHVQIRLHKCKAITLGGHIIQLEKDASIQDDSAHSFPPLLNASLEALKEKDAAYYVVLVVNPFERQPVGPADVNELPVRQPFTMPAYQLQLVPASEVNRHAIGHFHLPLGKLLVEEKKAFLDDEYIPPCSTVSSHPDLLQLHAALEKFFGKIEIHALQIIQKILQKKQQNTMAGIVQEICEQTILFTAINISSFTIITINQPPVFLLNTISSYARLLKNTLDKYTGSGKEELINYFIKWCNVSQGVLESAITTLAHHTYNHLEIKDFVHKASDFASMITTLFFNLSKLEYIGERPDKGIFVKEHIITTEEENPIKKRRSFLAD